MPTYRCNTHGVILEVSRQSPDHGEVRKAIVKLEPGSGPAPTHPCVMLLARTITPGKMKISDHLPGHVFGECEVVEVN